MYGLINRAMEELILTQYGPHTWDDIRIRAGFDEDGFLTQELYDDALTDALFDAASEVLCTPRSELLETFGAWWIQYAVQRGYGPMLEHPDKDLGKFLHGLDGMHTRVTTALQGAEMPSFYCSDATESSLSLHYVSKRRGLAPFVIGLLRGLAERFGVELEIVHHERKERGADHDVFLLTFHRGC